MGTKCAGSHISLHLLLWVGTLIGSIVNNFISVIMDPFVTCPYNYEHRVPKSRLQAHIVKCQRKYPELAICPYNATHRVLKSEITKHIMNCPSQVDVASNDVTPKCAITKPKIIVQRQYLTECNPEYEEWDD